MKMLAGLVQPHAGEIRLAGERVAGPLDKLLPGHRSIAYLSQHFELRNNYYVHEILDYANQLTADEAFNLYKVCQIEHLLARKPINFLAAKKTHSAWQTVDHFPKALTARRAVLNLDSLHRAVIKGN